MLFKAIQTSRALLDKVSNIKTYTMVSKDTPPQKTELNEVAKFINVGEIPVIT